MRAPRHPRLPAIVTLLAAAFTLGACIHIYSRVDVKPVPPVGTTDSVDVRTPVKAHLVDGSVVLFRQGARVSSDAIRGAGVRYNLARTESTSVQVMAMDSIAGMEAFETTLNTPATVVVSTLASAAGVVAVLGSVVLISCAADPKCFGSCPTFYSMDPSGEILEAEGFSYSIAPLFEARDVDRIGITATADGVLSLELRNEALETHFINQIALLEAEHSPSEAVVPDERGRPLALSHLIEATSAHDGGGRDVGAVLRNRDSSYFSSTAARLASVSEHDLLDHVELVIPRPAAADSVAVVLRMRNSLLNSVLFYEQMLGAAGARSLDWQAENLGSIGSAVEFGRWYHSRLGMRVSILQDGRYHEVRRIADAGPLAWKEMATLVPVPTSGDSLRVRLSFVADQWRIDRVRFALANRRPSVRQVAVAEVRDANGQRDDEALAALQEPDEHYLETVAGQYATLRFNATAGTATGTRTYLLVSQGYYVEWIRPAWVRHATTTSTFVPSDGSLLSALTEYRTMKDSLEARFYRTRIPVR